MQKLDRVILVRGDGSKWYEQAIFIVNPRIPQDQIPVDFVAEAERIVGAYITQKKGGEYTPPVIPKHKKSQRRANLVLHILMLLGCLAIFLILLLGLVT